MREENFRNDKIVVLGIYKSEVQAERAANRMRDEGFRASDISALLPAGDRTKEFVHQKSSKAPEGAAIGGAGGAVLGGALGWLAGIGSLVIPGVGPLSAAGPIMASLSGIGVVGTVGAIAGGLVGMGIPEYEAKRYEGRVRDGGILVSVHCDTNEWEDHARKIFEETGAESVSSTSEASADTEADPRSESARHSY